MKANEPMITGWIARNEDENLFFYEKKPERGRHITAEGYALGKWRSVYRFIPLFRDLFPKITWEDEPRKVTITIEEEKDAMAELNEKIELYAQHRAANGGSIKDVDKYLRELRGYEEE